MNIQQLTKILTETIAALKADPDKEVKADPKLCLVTVKAKRCDYTVEYDPTAELIMIKGGAVNRLRYRYELTVPEFVMLSEAINVFSNMGRIHGALRQVISALSSAIKDGALENDADPDKALNVEQVTNQVTEDSDPPIQDIPASAVEQDANPANLPQDDNPPPLPEVSENTLLPGEASHSEAPSKKK